jgi:hypothetical protein
MTYKIRNLNFAFFAPGTSGLREIMKKPSFVFNQIKKGFAKNPGTPILHKSPVREDSALDREWQFHESGKCWQQDLHLPYLK